MTESKAQLSAVQTKEEATHIVAPVPGGEWWIVVELDSYLRRTVHQAGYRNGISATGTDTGTGSGTFPGLPMNLKGYWSLEDVITPDGLPLIADRPHYICAISEECGDKAFEFLNYGDFALHSYGLLELSGDVFHLHAETVKDEDEDEDYGPGEIEELDETEIERLRKAGGIVRYSSGAIPLEMIF